MTEEIKKALTENTELTEQEYAEERQDTAETAANQLGVKYRPLTEATKHKRIQSNFYGSALNFMLRGARDNQTIIKLLTEIRDTLKGVKDERRE